MFARGVVTTTAKLRCCHSGSSNNLVGICSSLSMLSRKHGGLSQLTNHTCITRSASVMSSFSFLSNYPNSSNISALQKFGAEPHVNLDGTRIASFATAAPQQSSLVSRGALERIKDNGFINFVSLNNISDNPGANPKKRRIGRGIGSSKGKTSGRGHKGQKARAGKGVRPTFEGGQTPLFKRLPKRGFNNKRFAEEMIAINLGTLQDYIDMGRLSTTRPDGSPLTMKDLLDAGVCGSKFSLIKNHGMKLLAKGKERLRSPIKIHISRASQGAIEALEAVGGNVTTVHYNRLALRVLMRPHRYEGKLIPKQAKPPPKRMPYYTSYDNRGYLSLEKQLEQHLNLDSMEFVTAEQS